MKARFNAPTNSLASFSAIQIVFSYLRFGDKINVLRKAEITAKLREEWTGERVTNEEWTGERITTFGLYLCINHSSN